MKVTHSSDTKRKIMTSSQKIIVAITALLSPLILWWFVSKSLTDNTDACAAEYATLSLPEKRAVVITNFLRQTIEKWQRDRDRQYDARLYISQHDLSDREALIELMIASDASKSLEENFGIIAQASMPDYFSRKSEMARRPNRILDYEEGAVTNWFDQHNQLIMERLEQVSDQQTVLIEYGRGDSKITTIPLSSFQAADESGRIFDFQSNYFYQECCDKQTLDSMPQPWTPLYNAAQEKNGKGTFSHEEPEINIADIDGKAIDWPYITDLYENFASRKPEHIQRYVLLSNIAFLRDPDPIQYPKTLSVTACGDVLKDDLLF